MHAILFDIDGTLINTRGAGDAALNSAVADALGCAGQHRVEMSGRTDRAIVRDLFEAHGVENTDANWRKLSEHYLARLPAFLAEKDGFVLPGIPELLKSLTPREDVFMGLLTGNTTRGAELKLSHFGLWEHFSFGGYGDWHHDRDSVAVDAVNRLREVADIPPERITVIGDTPHDITCARHVGANAIAVLTGWHTREELAASDPDHLLDDLRDTEVVLSRLLTS